MLWVILATQIPLWAVAEVVLVQNLPQPQKLKWYNRQGVSKGEKLTSNPCADHTLCPGVAAPGGNGAESGVQVHEFEGHHPHHPFPTQPLGVGAGPWLGCLLLQFWQRAP